MRVKWQPIATAPSSQRSLLFCSNEGGVFAGSISRTFNANYDGEGGTYWNGAAYRPLAWCRYWAADMIWGAIKLFCPVCGVSFVFRGNCVSGTAHHKDLGYVCSMACHKQAEIKYTRMILGKNEEGL